MIPQLRRVRSDDNVVRQLQDASDAIFKVITVKEILDGILLEDISLLSANPNVINHKLGRKLRGYIIVRQDTNTNIWDSQTSNTTPSLTLVLNCGSNVTISLWVF